MKPPPVTPRSDTTFLQGVCNAVTSPFTNKYEHVPSSNSNSPSNTDISNEDTKPPAVSSPTADNANDSVPPAAGTRSPEIVVQSSSSSSHQPPSQRTRSHSVQREQDQAPVAQRTRSRSRSQERSTSATPSLQQTVTGRPIGSRGRNRTAKSKSPKKPDFR